MKSINVERFKGLFLNQIESKVQIGQFGMVETHGNTSGVIYEYFIKNRIPLHIGGLSDAFDYFEKQYKVGLKVIKFLDSINYPTIFSTKGTLMTEPEYLEVFKRNPKNWTFQFSIITSDDEKAKIVEAGAPSPTERLKAMKIMSDIGCKTILRFRPYIIGLSNLTAKDLIAKAKDSGASAISCEFFCLDTRMNENTKKRYDILTKVIGFDIIEYYRKLSINMGYLRLNRKVKEKYALEVYKEGRRLNMNVSFSDPDFKELGCSGCCCGLTKEEINYSHGQFTEALIYARKNGTVTWDFIAKDLEWTKSIIVDDTGIPMISEHADGRDKVVFKSIANQSLFDYFRTIWNNPVSEKSPYKYFHCILRPIGLDLNKNIIYKYIKQDYEEDLDVTNNKTEPEHIVCGDKPTPQKQRSLFQFK